MLTEAEVVAKVRTQFAGEALHPNGLTSVMIATFVHALRPDLKIDRLSYTATSEGERINIKFASANISVPASPDARD